MCIHIDSDLSKTRLEECIKEAEIKSFLEI